MLENSLLPWELDDTEMLSCISAQYKRSLRPYQKVPGSLPRPTEYSFKTEDMRVYIPSHFSCVQLFATLWL